MQSLTRSNEICGDGKGEAVVIRGYELFLSELLQISKIFFSFEGLNQNAMIHISYWVLPGLPNMAIEIIVERCVSHFDIPLKLLTGKRRDRNIVIARQITMFFLKKYTDLTLKEIGKLFNRDHTTALYSIRFIKERQHMDEFKWHIESLNNNMIL